MSKNGMVLLSTHFSCLYQHGNNKRKPKSYLSAVIVIFSLGVPPLLSDAACKDRVLRANLH